MFLGEYKIQQNSEDYDYAFQEEKWDFKLFEEHFKVCVVRFGDMEMEFDMINVDPAIANALRRIILSEVPTMAIEKVYFYNNTTIIQDEVLAHRLGLIPLKADSRIFEYKNGDCDEGTENDTLEFELKVKCTRRKDVKDSSNFESIYKNYKVFSGQIKWLPRGKQVSLHSECDVGPIHDDILISQMCPGHELDLKLIAIKGIGKNHAKFSPVATVFYRLLPKIKLNRTVFGKEAFLLQKCFSPGVIGIDENGYAYVKSPRYDTCSRNVYKYQQLSDAVTMSRVRNHFIFVIESIGALTPNVIFIESIKILKNKCRKFLQEMGNIQNKV